MKPAESPYREKEADHEPGALFQTPNTRAQKAKISEAIRGQEALRIRRITPQADDTSSVVSIGVSSIRLKRADSTVSAGGKLRLRRGRPSVDQTAAVVS